MKWVEMLDLEKVMRVAEAHATKEQIEKLRYNIRFVTDLKVYEEIIGPTIHIPEEMPEPEIMALEDFRKMVDCDNIEVMPDGNDILRWCRAFTVLQTKQVDDKTIDERRPIKWPERLNTEMQEVSESDIELRRQTEKMEQIHEGTKAVCEDLTHSYHQVGMEPEVRNLFGIHIQVNGKRYVVRVKRMPMGFVKAADVMNAVVTSLATAAVSIPERAKDVHIDNFRMIGDNAKMLTRAQGEFREACAYARVTLNDDDLTRVHDKGKYCGVIYDYRRKTVQLKESFVDKVRENIEQMNRWTMSDMMETFGRLFSGAEILAAPLWRWYAAIKFYRRRMASDEDNRKPAKVWPCSVHAINEWADFLKKNEPRRVPDPGLDSVVTVFTDAATSGWGTVVIEEKTGKVHVFGGRFPRWSWTEEHINVKEARAVEESVHALYRLFDDFPTAVTWKIDNTSALGATRKGRSKVFELNKVIANIREQIPRTTTTRFEYVPSSLNWADAPSRGKRLDIDEIIQQHYGRMRTKDYNYVEKGVVGPDFPTSPHIVRGRHRSESRGEKVLHPRREFP